MLLWFCLEKELCMSNAWFKREEKGKMAFIWHSSQAVDGCL